MNKSRSELASLQNQGFYQMCRLAQVTATLNQLPGSRPITHEPGPIQCVAREWPRPGATLARLRSDPSVKRASQGDPPRPYIWNERMSLSVMGEVHRRPQTVVFRQIPQEIFAQVYRTLFTGGKLPKLYGNQNFWFKRLG